MPPRHRHRDYSATGTYMPKGGGSQGWYENRGVARTEQGNRYRYHEAVDALGFRHAEVEQQVWINNRGAERKEVRIQVRYRLDPDTPPLPGLCLNISLTGAMIRIGRQLKPGLAVNLLFVEREELRGEERSLLSLDGAVVWSRSVDPRFRNPRYDCGLKFDPLDISAKERLSLVLTDRMDQLLDDPLLPPETPA
jgi:hypothetical protein